MASYTTDDSSDDIARVILESFSFYPEEGSSDDRGSNDSPHLDLEVRGVKIQKPTGGSGVIDQPQIRFRWNVKNAPRVNERLSLVLTSITGTEIDLTWYPELGWFESDLVKIPIGYHSAFILITSQEDDINGEKVIRETDYKVDSFFVTPLNQSIQLFLQSDKPIHFWQDIGPIRKRYLSAGHIEPTHYSDHRESRIRSVSLQELHKPSIPDFETKFEEEDSTDEKMDFPKRVRPRSAFCRSRSQEKDIQLSSKFQHLKSRSAVLEDIPSENTFSDDKLTSRTDDSKNNLPSLENNLLSMSFMEIKDCKVEKNSISKENKEQFNESELDLITRETEDQINAAEKLLDSDSDIEVVMPNFTLLRQKSMEKYKSGNSISDDEKFIIDESKLNDTKDKLVNQRKISLGDAGQAGSYGCVITFESRSTSLDDVGSPRALEEALVSLTSNGDNNLLEAFNNQQSSQAESSNVHITSVEYSAEVSSVDKIIELPDTPNNSRDINQNDLCGNSKIQEIFEDRSYMIENSELEDTQFPYDSTCSDENQFIIDIKGINSDDSDCKRHVTSMKYTTEKSKRKIRIDKMEDIKEDSRNSRSSSAKSNSVRKSSRRNRTVTLVPSEPMDTTIESDEDMRLDTRYSRNSNESSSSQGESTIQESKTSKSKARSSKFQSGKKGLYVVNENRNKENSICSCTEGDSTGTSKVMEDESSTRSSYSNNYVSSSTDIDSKGYKDDVSIGDDSEIKLKPRKGKRLCSHTKCKKLRTTNSKQKYVQTLNATKDKGSCTSAKHKNISIQTSARLNFPSKATSTKVRTCDKEIGIQSFSITESSSSRRKSSSYQSLPNKFQKPWLSSKDCKERKTSSTKDLALKNEINKFKTNFQKLRSVEDKLKELEIQSPSNRTHRENYSCRFETDSNFMNETDESNTIYHKHTHEHLHSYHEPHTLSPQKTFTSLPSSPHLQRFSTSNKTTARSGLLSTPSMSYIRRTTSYEPYSTKFSRDKSNIIGDFKPYKTNTNVTINRTLSLDGSGFPTAKKLDSEYGSRERIRDTSGGHQRYAFKEDSKQETTVNLLTKLRLRLQKILYDGPTTNEFPGRISLDDSYPDIRSRHDAFDTTRSSFRQTLRRNRSLSQVQPVTSFRPRRLFSERKPLLSSLSSLSDLDGSTDSLLGHSRHISFTQDPPHYRRRSYSGRTLRTYSRNESTSPPRLRPLPEPYLPGNPTELKLNQMVKVLVRGGVKQARVVHVDDLRGTVSVRPDGKSHSIGKSFIDVPFEKILLAWPS